MTTSFLPIWIVDVGGAVLMIVISIYCVRYAARLRKRDPHNIVWAYLLWVSLALSLFAFSRSVGHIAKQMLILLDQREVWEVLRPYSGSINTLTFMVVGALTLFFERTWTVYQGMLRDRQALQHAHSDLLFLNQNLEQMVSERTAALALSEARYRSIFEASKDMIVTAEPDGRILDLNPAGYDMLGLQPGALPPDCRFPDFITDPQRWQTLQNDIHRQGFISSVELDLSTADGNRLRALLSGSIAGSGDDTIHFLVKDIEQQRLIREQMAQADKLASIGELSAGIAHEINNPMGIILGYTQLMLRQESTDSQRRDDLRTVEKHVRHCKSIVEDLLSFARTSQPKKELLDIREIIDDVLHFIRQHAKPERIRIETEYDHQLGPLLLDEKKIKQVLINLIMNAVHAIAGEGAIRVCTRMNPKTHQAEISIQDTGGGIEPQHMARIFDPFFTTKPTGQGTGLGLSVSYGIIKNHGGDIDVESTAGQGSIFTVHLPIPLTAAAAAYGR
jgi:two-component system, NtrC family, sensor kinase